MRLALIVVGSTIGVLAGLVGIGYAASQAFDTTKTDAYEFRQRVKHVVVEADAGDVEVTRGGRRLEVEETRHYVLESPELSRGVERGVLTLKGECEGVLFALCETDYRVEVPAGVTVEVRTHVGDIEAEGIDARRIEARSNVGDITIDSRRRARIDARTNVGDVKVTVPPGTGGVDADTDLGAVDVAWRGGRIREP